MNQAVKLLAIMVVLALVVGFIMLNPWMLDQANYIKFYYTPPSYGSHHTTPLPVLLYMALSVLLGASIISVVMFTTQLKFKRKVKEHSKTIELMEQELSELRNLPITEIEDSIEEKATFEEDTKQSYPNDRDLHDDIP